MDMTGISPLKGRPVVFGEVLFDCFDDGSAVLGGAPFNVAWHLQGFGLAPLFISRIGDDPLGRQVIEAMDDWGMDTSTVQRDDRHPTGTVQVTLGTEGQPTFDIVPEQAYDFIEADEAQGTLQRGDCSLLYHGSLITRNAVSANTLRRLQTDARLPAFVDVNLRSPWWRKGETEQALAGARWVKLNDGELAELSDTELAAAPLETVADTFRREHGIGLLIVTLGSKGALLIDAAGSVRDLPKPIPSMVDTVGAGDAFSAVAILGLSRGWPPSALLQRAMAFAGAVCGIRGATTRDRGLYARFLTEWNA